VSSTNASSAPGTAIIAYEDEFEVEIDDFKVLLINKNLI